MELGAAARTALGLEKPPPAFAAPRHAEAAASRSLLQVVDQTVSRGGGRALRGWLRAPLRDVAEIRRRQSLVGFLVEDAVTRDSLRSGGVGASLRGCPDVAGLTAKLRAWDAAAEKLPTEKEGRSAKAPTLKDLVALYRVALRLRCAQGILADATSQGIADTEVLAVISEAFVLPLKQAVSQVARFQALVEEVVDPASMAGARRWTRFKVRSSFHPELTRLQGALDEATEALEAAADGVRATGKAGKDSQGRERMKLDRTPVHTWHLRVTKRDQGLVKKVAGARTVAVQSSGLLFTTDVLQRAALRRDKVEAAYDEAQRQVEIQALAVGKTYCDVFDRAAALLAELDALAALAYSADVHGWSRPELLSLDDAPGGKFLLQLEELKHPCVAAVLGDAFIANDLRMSGAADRRVCIMTGPNCGGKSTFIRSVGIAVLLAQAGSFVPARSMRATPFSRIVTRVGSSDNQTKGHSTFFAECTEVAEMLDEADDASLLIIDELGRGTDTFDGFGIAWGVCKHVGQRIGAACLFATHFHEVTELASAPVAAEEPTIGAFNLHVAADTSGDELVMLYEVREGYCDRSFGCHVARMASMPPAIVQEAEALTADFEAASGFRIYDRPGAEVGKGTAADGAEARKSGVANGGATAAVGASESEAKRQRVA